MDAIRRSVIAALLAAGPGLVAHAESHLAGGNIAEGEKLARELCAQCHHVEAGGQFKHHPPTFSAIAVYRSQEQIFGRIVYPPLHTGMPTLGFRLSPDNMRHLIAYIASLEKR